MEQTKEKMSQLEQAAAMAQQYQSQQQAGAQGTNDASDVNSSKKDDDVIDADFTDKAN